MREHLGEYNFKLNLNIGLIWVQIKPKHWSNLGLFFGIIATLSEVPFLGKVLYYTFSG